MQAAKMAQRTIVSLVLGTATTFPRKIFVELPSATRYLQKRVRSRAVAEQFAVSAIFRQFVKFRGQGPVVIGSGHQP